MRPKVRSLPLRRSTRTRRSPATKRRPRSPARARPWSDACFFLKSVSTWRNPPHLFGRVVPNRSCCVTFCVHSGASVSKRLREIVEHAANVGLEPVADVSAAAAKQSRNANSHHYRRSAIHGGNEMGPSHESNLLNLGQLILGSIAGPFF